MTIVSLDLGRSETLVRGKTMNSFNCEQHIDEVMQSQDMIVEYDIWRMQRDMSALTLAEAQQIAWDKEDAQRKANRGMKTRRFCRD